MYLVTAREMQQMDRDTIHAFGIPGRVLMENAGRGATRFFLKAFAPIRDRQVGVMAGRGNNGGDGFVMARYLAQKGLRVTVYLLSTPERVQGDALANLNLLQPLGVEVVQVPDPETFSSHLPSMRRVDIWIDAVLGTGLKSEVRGHLKTAIDFMNSLGKPVFSVDLPSGLDSDTGTPRGSCIRATATSTFAYAKIGHHVYPGAACTGKLDVVDIGIPPFIAEKIAPRQYLLTRRGIRSSLVPRPADTHKGRSGHLLVIAGSPGKTGAAAMSAMSAMRSGAGLVTLGVPQGLNPVLEPMVTEAMTVPLPQTREGLLARDGLETILGIMDGKDCIAIGPGLGTAAETRTLVHGILKAAAVPVVVDADGLNLLAEDPGILKTIKTPVILTPHPGEMARLANTTVPAVQNNRIKAARDFAVKFGVHLVLKGAATVVSHPDGRIFVNPTGNSGMASGGMGDVLTGMISGFATQGLSAASAARAAVYLHGAAGDALASGKGPFGFLATDLMETIPEQIGKLLKGN